METQVLKSYNILATCIQPKSKDSHKKVHLIMKKWACFIDLIDKLMWSILTSHRTTRCSRIFRKLFLRRPEQELSFCLGVRLIRGRTTNRVKTSRRNQSLVRCQDKAWCSRLFSEDSIRILGLTLGIDHPNRKDNSEEWVTEAPLPFQAT